MRSRFSAFAVGDAAYLLRTWHPATRPPRVDLDPELTWGRLEILGRSGGGLFDTEGTVEFRAHHRYSGRSGVLDEHSRFTRDGGTWRYVGPIPAR
jgi:SEC-C motif-containing protein